MRVLTLTHVFPRTTTDPCAPFLLDWARGLVAAGAEVGVLAPHDAGLPARHAVGGITVRRVRYAPERWERLAYRGEMHRIARTAAGPPLVGGLVGALALALRAQARLGRPDVLHVHWCLPGAVAAATARTGVPTVVTVHGTDIALLDRRPRLARVVARLLARSERVEAVSAALADDLERLTGRAADAVNPMPLGEDLLGPPAEPLEPSRAAGDGMLRVLAVGRLVPEKGFAALVSAVALVGVSVRLEILGTGPLQAQLRAQARAVGIRLDLPGRVDRAALRAAYARADLVVVPSQREGLGLVVVEALLAGTPVVATDSGGVRDLLPAAALVPLGDVNALAAAIRATAADLDRARARTAALTGPLRERFTPAAAAARTLAGYRAITGT